MDEVKNLLREIGVEVLAGAIFALLITVGGAIWASLRTDPDPVLLGMLIVISLLNISGIIYFYYRLRNSLEDLRQSSHTLNEHLQEQGQRLEDLQGLLVQSPLIQSQSGEVNLGRRLRDFFPITKKKFRKELQLVEIEFTNQSDSIFHVREVRYSDDKLLDSEIEFRQRSSKDKYRRPLLDFDRSRAEVPPGKSFPLTINLKRPWTQEEFDIIAGQLARLYVEVEYKDVVEDIGYSI